MKFRAGELEFNASVVDSAQTRSPQTGNPLQQVTIQFRAQKAGVHQAAVTEALQRQSGGLFSLTDAGELEDEWRVRESNWSYVGSEPWGVNHHVWRIEQVERFACTLLRLGTLELEPYDYVESVSEVGLIRLAARATVTDVQIEQVSRLLGTLQVTRVGISDEPRQMRLSGYVWGPGSEGTGVVVACEDVRQPRVTLSGFDGSLAADLEDLVDLATLDRDELRRRRHAQRRVDDVDAWDLNAQS